MAVNSVVSVQTPKITPQSWTNSDAANTQKTLATAGASGSKIVAVNATSTDTTVRVFYLELKRASVTYKLGSATIAVTSGTDGVTQATNLLSLIPGLPLDNDGQPYIFLESGDVLQGENVTQVTAAKEVDIVTIFGNF